MKKTKKRHRRKRARTGTSSSNSSELSYSVTLNSNKRHNRRSSTFSCASPSSILRSSSLKKKTTRSGCFSTLDLGSKEKSKSIAFYINSREEMVHQMFASLHRRELYELLPANLKKLGIAELRYLCIKELNGMSEKRIYAILTGRNFAESSESQGEEDEALVVNANIKASKAEIAVADSTTEMTTPSLTILSSISQTIDTGDDFFKNDNLNAPEIHFTPVKSTSLAQIRQKNEDVVQPDFLLEQATVVMVEENDSELEEGEVVSGQETSSSSSRSSTAVKDQNCNQYFTIHRNIISDSIFFDSSPASVSKNPENTESSIYTTDNVQEQRKLRMLELELRARAIEALIRRSDKP